MSRPKSNYTLFKVGKIWYYYSYDIFGRRLSKKTTGEKSKVKADLYCQTLMKQNLLSANSSLKVKDYIKRKHFFEYGKCEYLSERDVTRVYGQDCLSRMTNHILPTLGEMQFTKLTPQVITTWQKELKNVKGLSPKTVKQVRSVLRIIIQEAIYDGFLQRDPIIGAKDIGRSNSKVRGILTKAEAIQLLNRENLEGLWNNNVLYYTTTLIAYYTGMRQGEIIGLTVDKILEDVIVVDQSYNIKTKTLGPTKTKETRVIPLPIEVKEALEKVMPKAGYILSFSHGESPITGNRVTQAFNRAIDRLGIERKKREIKFHSLRHGFVTNARSEGLSDAQIRVVTGQKTSRVVDGYTRFDRMDKSDIIRAMDSLSVTENPALLRAIDALKALGSNDALNAIQLLVN